MTEGFLLGRVTLHFSAERKDDLREDLSAVALDADNNLWVASDEKAGVERLRPADRGVFADHQFFDLVNAFDLAAPEDAGEIDIEGMNVEGTALWITGSHTSTRKKPKGKADRKDLVRLSKVIRKPNRFVLGRIPVSGGAGRRRRPTAPHRVWKRVDGSVTRRSASRSLSFCPGTRRKQHSACQQGKRFRHRGACRSR